MKVTCRQDRKAAIAAGIEPSSTGTVDVDIDLSTLSAEQRQTLAELSPLAIMVVGGGATEVVVWLDARIAARAEKARAEKEYQEQNDAKANEWIRTVEIVPAGPRMMSGVPVSQWRLSDIMYPGLCSPEIQSAVRTRETELRAEIARLEDEALTAAQPAITAAKAEMEEKAAQESAAKEAAKRITWAERLESGVYTVECSRGDRSDWGEPWIAKVTTRNGKRPEYDFGAGSYDLATETLSIPCVPGDVIAYGQKNYRKPKKTIHEILRMRDDGAMVSA